MKGDFSRPTFDRKKHYDAVLFQQGRVQLDADLNEQQDILRHRLRTETRDVIGWSGAPKYGGGFHIDIAPGYEDLTISPGRMYVDGLLVCAESDAVKAGTLLFNKIEYAATPAGGMKFEKDDWIEIIDGKGFSWTALVTGVDETKSTLQFKPELTPDDLKKIADPKKLKIRTLLSYRRQPDFPTIPPLANGRHLVYLDVWERFVCALDDPGIREKALGGPDTAGRLRTVWQVKLEKVSDQANCDKFGPKWRPENAKADGRLSVHTALIPTVTDPCLLPAQAGYRGLENQLYRVEIHQGGRLGQDKVTFKWSRDNGSVVTSIEKISGFTVVVSGMGPDDVLGFGDNQWVEILDDRNDLLQQPGQFLQIDTADRNTNTITLKTKPVALANTADGVVPSLHPKLRRWDNKNGEIKAEIPSTNDGRLKIENDVEIKFTAGTYRTGDYWIIPARTAVGSEVGSLDWPLDENELPLRQTPHGLQHQYAPLAIVDVENGKFIKPPVSDCRNIFPPLIDLGEGDQPGARGCCCTFLVGDGIKSYGDFDDIETALAHLPDEGGQLCVLPGDHRANAVINRSNIIISGCGLRTKISPKTLQEEQAVFSIVDCGEIVLRDLCILNMEGTAIAAEEKTAGKLKGVDILSNKILAYENAIRINHGSGINIEENDIRMLDRVGAGVAVFLDAKDVLVERNEITLSRTHRDVPDIKIPGSTRPFNPHDDCLDFELIYENRRAYNDLSNRIFARRKKVVGGAAEEIVKARSQGGIQVGAGSERIVIRENDIFGGAGNGITLGGRLPAAEKTEEGGTGIGARAAAVVSVTHDGGAFKARVEHAEKAKPGTAFRLVERNTGESRNILADAGGELYVSNLTPGEYALSSMSPGLKIDKAVLNKGDLSHRIEVAPVKEDSEETDLKESLAFLREILIEGNRISGMGLSGIGTARLDLKRRASGGANAALLTARINPVWSLLEIYGNPVADLTVDRNRIYRCLQAHPDDYLKADLARKGLGGISLGICEHVSINGNFIEDNGVSPTPVSGIFIAYGEHVDICRNRILDNGTLPDKMSGNLEPGFRGGIVIMLASCLFDFNALDKGLFSASLGLFAARIHGNVVAQPVGRALTVNALGPVSVEENYFNSQWTGPGFLNPLAGAVYLLNIGRTSGAAAATSENFPMVSRTAATAAWNLWPNGSILYQNNQTLVGPMNQSLMTHVVGSLDDVGFSDNVIDSRQRLSGSMVNVFVLSRTARVGSNRCLEPNQAAALSILSATTSMNNTSDNQGDHCIIAVSQDASRLAAPDNLTLSNPTVCAYVTKHFYELIRNK